MEFKCINYIKIRYYSFSSYVRELTFYNFTGEIIIFLQQEQEQKHYFWILFSWLYEH